MSQSPQFKNHQLKDTMEEKHEKGGGRIKYTGKKQKSYKTYLMKTLSCFRGTQKTT